MLRLTTVHNASATVLEHSTLMSAFDEHTSVTVTGLHALYMQKYPTVAIRKLKIECAAITTRRRMNGRRLPIIRAAKKNESFNMTLTKAKMHTLGNVYEKRLTMRSACIVGCSSS